MKVQPFHCLCGQQLPFKAMYITVVWIVPTGKSSSLVQSKSMEVFKLLLEEIKPNDLTETTKFLVCVNIEM